MLPETKGRQRQTAKGKRKLIGTYAAQGQGSSKASRQRNKKACKDLCCPRPKTVKDESSKAYESL